MHDLDRQLKQDAQALPHRAPANLRDIHRVARPRQSRVPAIAGVAASFVLVATLALIGLPQPDNAPAAISPAPELAAALDRVSLSLPQPERSLDAELDRVGQDLERMRELLPPWLMRKSPQQG